MSSREASLSLNAELLRVLGSDVPPSATVAECGRDWDLCRGTVLLALPAEGERTEGEGGPGLPDGRASARKASHLRSHSPCANAATSRLFFLPALRSTDPGFLSNKLELANTYEVHPPHWYSITHQ